MARSLDNAQLYLANCQFVAIRDGPMWKAGAGLLAKNDLCAGARRELAMTADKISVQMSFDDVLDLQAPDFSLFKILLDIALRIDHGGLTLRSDQVRGVGETVEIELF